MDAYELSDLLTQHRQSGRPYQEFLRWPSMSLGVYVLPAGGVDTQQPHTEDEVYYVVSGRGMIRVGEVDRPVGPGTTIAVARSVPHRFHSIDSELTLLVFFAPAEGALKAGER